MAEGNHRPWWRAVWGNANTPKHSFISWLVMHGRILTRDRLYNMGLCREKDCTLCGNCDETIKHLFFECVYSKYCLEEIMKWLQIHGRNLELEGMWSRLARKAQGKISRSLLWAVWTALIYHIWEARNEALWQQRVPRPQRVIVTIQLETKVRIFDILNRKTRCKDKEWIEELYK
ncbi:uncharacterized protein LOC132639147 [Lycium barbarum]|uniref:uncharacterized protein LOC132639147 n=1 Tax=Lycium barbarum TaxID=112863 RepID=UPI00293E50D0|nr:uncharacterized protein LOC132639147 [Lycium barbarum]